MRAPSAVPSGIFVCALWWNCQVSVLTYHNDLARTGQNLSETQLTPATVSSEQFGPLFRLPVDGQIYTQPLYLAGVIVPGKGIHNIIFVATEHDSVYAFDADHELGAPLWKTSFINPAQQVTTASAAEIGCGSITPEIGITGTPVVDPASGTLYVEAMTEEGPNGNYVHRLHALDVATGLDKPGSPVEVQASVPGIAGGTNIVKFEPWLYKERAGLLLLNGVVYTAWSSHCDSGNYHGWIIGYDAQSLQQVAAFTSTPNWDAGSFWQGGAAPAADAAGNIYAVSANGTFDANRGGSDLGESVLKLSTGAGLAVADYFTPYDAETLADKDLDLGSSGALLLPDEAGSAAHPHLLVTGSKSGSVYVLDRDRMGRFQPDGNGQIVESLQNAVGPVFGIPAYFNHTVYFSAAHDQIKAFAIQDGQLSALPASASAATFAVLGTVPSISANGLRNGVLWTIDPAGELHAYDASDLTRQLYQGYAGSYIMFSTPTVANGKVYVGTRDSVAVFGLKEQSPGVVTAVLNADGSEAHPLSSGSLISIFGSNLARRAVQASRTPWPQVLEFTSVFVNGVAAPVGYVSPAQINAQVPLGTKAGHATLTVVAGGRVLPPVEFTVQAAPSGRKGVH